MTTPPQGQNPFAQTPPQGAPQGGNPYGQTGPMGAAPYPQGGGFQGPPMAPQPPKRNKAKLIVGIIVALGVAGAVIASVVSSQDDADTAKVGDCMHRGSQSDTNPDLEVVDCTGTTAQYKVTAKVKGSYLTALTASAACGKVTKDFDNYYTESGGGEDFLLCLKEIKK